MLLCHNKDNSAFKRSFIYFCLLKIDRCVALQFYRDGIAPLQKSYKRVLGQAVESITPKFPTHKMCGCHQPSSVVLRSRATKLETSLANRSDICF